MAFERCSTCGKPRVYLASYNGRAFCENHFLEFVLKKVKKNLQKHELIRPGDRVSTTDPTLSDVLARVTKEWPIKLTKTNPNKLAEPLSLNQEIAMAIDALAKGEVLNTGFKQGKRIFPFRNLQTQELELYSKLRGIERDTDCSTTEKLVTELEKQMPSTLFSFQTSFERMAGLARPR
ncbi:MAG: hypothetical protein GOU99_01465 [Candidatus Altiarchaeota archaeon]|nr:hypothetical protein [Candidatus Altiarchaeota archaeon]